MSSYYNKYFYHGTVDIYLDDIKKNGLVPTICPEAASLHGNKNKVLYVTDDLELAEYWAKYKAGQIEDEFGDVVEPVVLRLVLSPGSIVKPDVVEGTRVHNSFIIISSVSPKNIDIQIGGRFDYWEKL